MELSIQKWYVDVVTDDGRVGIAYRAEVRQGELRHDVAGVMLSPGAGAEPVWRFSLRSTPPPEQSEHGLRWSAERLALTIDCEAREPGFEASLLRTPDGSVDWRCAVPRARVRMRTRDTILEGLGYAERLDLIGIAPWNIPADEIRWGRFLTDQMSLVWVDWRGAIPRRFVFRDGRLVDAIETTDEGILLGDGSRLTLCDAQLIGNDTLGDWLAPLAPLRSLIRPIARAHQSRWLARGEFRAPLPGAEPLRGWVLHELLRRR